MIKISRENRSYFMSGSQAPAGYAKSGDTAVFETMDCYTDQIKVDGQSEENINREHSNPATGPLYIEDAEVGDMLKVEINDIKIDNVGAMSLRAGVGTFGQYLDDRKNKLIPIVDGFAVMSDKIKLPVNTMIGVIGVAPEGEDIDTTYPGLHGANMDCKRIVKGSIVYLPVFVKGALLSMGDLHAVMGDGEVAICGVETRGEVTVKIDVIKDKKLPLPMVVEGGQIMTIASAKTLDEAARQASINMFKFLTSEVNVDPFEAGRLLSVTGDLRICQIVDPLMTARMELPLDILEKYNYTMA